jgi:hypothetical protein
VFRGAIFGVPQKDKKIKKHTGPNLRKLADHQYSEDNVFQREVSGEFFLVRKE